MGGDASPSRAGLRVWQGFEGETVGRENKKKIFLSSRRVTVNLTQYTRDRGGFNVREMVLT
jgi:hypothetical protein